MDIVAWDDSLSVGFGAIDGQHRWLIGLINGLHDRVTAGDPTRLSTAVKDLHAYTSTHFQAEETLMKAHDYPERAAHFQEHATFRRALDDIEGKMARQEELISFATLGYLVDWFIDHISRTDKKLGRFLKDQGLDAPAQ